MRFVSTSVERKLMPVALPPGRARLATRPSLTGSSGTLKAIGIDWVAAFAASAAELPEVAITLARRRTRSAASAGNRSNCAARHAMFDRHVLAFDMAGFGETAAECIQERPTRSDRLRAEKPHHRHRLLRARRKRPHAAAPPSSVMNSRRIIQSPRRHGREASAEFRGRASLRFAD